MPAGASAFRKYSNIYIKIARKDEIFFQNLEKKFRDISVFQFPIMQFPEAEPINELKSYEQFKGYLITDEIKWYFGNYKNSKGEIFYQKLKDKEESKIYDFIKENFDGILIYKKAYQNNILEKKYQLIITLI